MGVFVSNLDKLKKAGCDLFIASYGDALMGVSEGELGNVFMPDSVWIAGVDCADECDPERCAEMPIIWIDPKMGDGRFGKLTEQHARDTVALTMMRLI